VAMQKLAAGPSRRRRIGGVIMLPLNIHDKQGLITRSVLPVTSAGSGDKMMMVVPGDGVSFVEVKVYPYVSTDTANNTLTCRVWSGPLQTGGLYGETWEGTNGVGLPNAGYFSFLVAPSPNSSTLYLNLQNSVGTPTMHAGAFMEASWVHRS
jgi:hypothetical protein